MAARRYDARPVPHADADLFCELLREHAAGNVWRHDDGDHALFKYAPQLVLARAWTPAIAQALPCSVRFAAAGGLAFVLSDSLLAWDRFGGGFPLAQPLILSTYWFAQWCIARSVQAR